MRWYRRLFIIAPITTPGASALAYVPFVMGSRTLAFIRLLLVARILGDAGQHEYGIYRPALEFINPLVALLLFGGADVAERYASRILRDHNGAALAQWLRRQNLRILLTGLFGAVLLIVVAPWISAAVWGSGSGSGRRSILLVAACAITVVMLALYQHLSAVLRGIQAYRAAAGMELVGAVLLLILSAMAAAIGGAVALLLAYAFSVMIPLVAYGTALWRYLRHVPQLTSVAGDIPSIPVPDPTPFSFAMPRFAAWSLFRLLLVMTFGFLSLWGVRFLAAHQPGNTDPDEPLRATANYAMAYTIAQLLAYVALTLWASSYGIAARAWSHGQVHRARVQLFRVGKFGATALILLAVMLLLARGGFAAVMPAAYSDAILTLLPGLLALFIAYAMVAFSSTYADLQEVPQKGAVLWAVAVGFQIVGIIWGRLVTVLDPTQHMLQVSVMGLGAALLLAPALLCRPLRFTATGVPLVILTLAAGSLFAPAWVVDYFAPPILIGAVIFLYAARLLIRPIDRRSIRRWRKQH